MKTILALLCLVLFTIDLKAACASFFFQGNPNAYPGLIAWWKSDILSLTNNAPVGDTGVEWTDSSSFGRNASQAGATARPLFKTNIFGTKPSIRFDGSNDALDFTDISLPGINPVTVIIVGASIGVVDAELLGHSTTNIQHRVYETGNNMSFFGGSISLQSATLSRSLQSVNVLSWRVSGTICTFRQNVTDYGTGGIGGPNPMTLNRIGRTSFGGFANWDYAEILVYSTLLTDAQLDGLYYGYFRGRYTDLP